MVAVAEFTISFTTNLYTKEVFPTLVAPIKTILNMSENSYSISIILENGFWTYRADCRILLSNFCDLHRCLLPDSRQSTTHPNS